MARIIFDKNARTQKTQIVEAMRKREVRKDYVLYASLVLNVIMVVYAVFF